MGLAIELSLQEREKEAFASLKEIVHQLRSLADVRDMLPQVRELLGKGYEVGSGANHIWIHRFGEKERLAFIGENSSRWQEIANKNKLKKKDLAVISELIKTQQIKVGGKPKSQNKGFTDLPLFKQEDNQTKLF